MKKFIFSFLILFAAANSFAQTTRYQSKQFTLISFNYQISNDLKAKLTQFEQLFPETESRKADRIIGPAKEITWYLLKARLEKETGMYILPINSQGNKFKYDVYNFPSLSINSALKRGTSRNYMKVDIMVSSGITKKETGYGANSKNETNALDLKNNDLCIPSVTIELTLYNDKGILPIRKEIGTAVASEAWDLSEEVFTGIVNRKEYDRNRTNTLLGLTNAAITKLFNRL